MFLKMQWLGRAYLGPPAERLDRHDSQHTIRAGSSNPLRNTSSQRVSNYAKFIPLQRVSCIYSIGHMINDIINAAMAPV